MVSYILAFHKDSIQISALHVAYNWQKISYYYYYYWIACLIAVTYFKWLIFDFDLHLYQKSSFCPFCSSHPLKAETPILMKSDTTTTPTLIPSGGPIILGTCLFQEGDWSKWRSDELRLPPHIKNGSFASSSFRRLKKTEEKHLNVLTDRG